MWYWDLKCWGQKLYKTREKTVYGIPTSSLERKKTALKIIGGLEASSQRLAAFQDLRTSDPAQRSVIN